MSFRRFALAIVITLLLQSAAMHAATTASCTFDTFAAPSGYSFSLVGGVSDDGTVVGQLLNNSTQQSEAFTRSASGVITKYAAPQSSTTWMYGRNGKRPQRRLLPGLRLPRTPSRIPPARQHLHRRQPSQRCQYLAVRRQPARSLSRQLQRQRVCGQGIQARQWHLHHDRLSECTDNLCHGYQ